MSMNPFHSFRLPRAPYNLALNTSHPVRALILVRAEINRKAESIRTMWALAKCRIKICCDSSINTHPLSKMRVPWGFWLLSCTRPAVDVDPTHCFSISWERDYLFFVIPSRTQALKRSNCHFCELTASGNKPLSIYICGYTCMHVW